MTGSTRRRLLAAAGSGLVGALAGCGYRPGGGELAWERSLSTGGFPGGGATAWVDDGDLLVRVENREGRDFDPEREEWVEVSEAEVTAYDAAGDVRWRGSAARQFAGGPTVGPKGVYVPLRDGGVTALRREGDDAGAVRWTNDRVGRVSRVVAGEEAVVAFGEAGPTCLDAAGEATGAADPIPVAGTDVGSVAVGGGHVWATARDEATVYGAAVDGGGRVEVTLPDSPTDLAALGDGGVVAAVDDGLRAVDPDGADRWTADVRAADHLLVAGDRLYAVAGAAVVAVDAANGERRWRHEMPLLRPPAADGEGVYGAVSGCRFQALTAAGEEWWSVPTPDAEGEGCDMTHFTVLGDRMVVVDGDRLYGVRKRPGDRWTLL
ncbi:outer membrane protein assembly factor BamB family protein [Halostella litorea]|uniref:outer membrane protein assembly factor BamB family protein n=1 Tax=Halostella litorea TaxID=2528831 RepID=UPI001092146C|nr:PQQ-binding-like beta-propeller repeat protein [Halostella litorea]